MTDLKQYLKAAILIIVFFLLSEFLISVSLNSSYKPMTRKDNVAEVEFSQAESTLVNGRMKGKIKASKENNLAGKYVQIDFYSKRDILAGTKYIPIKTNDAELTQDFTAYFELQDIASYSVSIVDKKGTDEIELLPEELTRAEIVVGTMLAILIFWG